MTKERTLAATTTRYALFILGMHRSGTSVLSGILHQLGVGLPRTLMPATEHNPKGYFESLEIQKFDDRLLEAAQSSWQDWRPLRPEWLASPAGQELRPEARKVLGAEFGDAPLIAIKDPRICRMMPFWDDVARDSGYQPCYILTHRNPMEVARSLTSRDGIDMSKALLLWLRHVLDAEAASRGKPRFFTNYEMLLQNWPSQVVRLQETLQIVLPHFDESASERIEEFLSRDLRHYAELPEKITGNPALSMWIRDTYEILERWVVLGGENSKDYKRFDEIRKAFDEASPLFGQMHSHAETYRDGLHVKLAERGKALEEARAQGESQARAVAEAEAAKTAAEQERENLRTMLEEVRVQGENQARAVAAVEAAKTAAEQECENLRTTLAAREAELDKSQQDHRTLEGKAQEMDSLLSQRRAEIANTNAALQETRNELQTRLASFETIEARLLETTVEAKRLRVEKDRLESELSQLSVHFLAQEDAVSRCRTEAETSAKRVQELRAALEEAQSGEQSRNEKLQAAHESLKVLRGKFGQSSPEAFDESLEALLEQIGGVLSTLENRVKDGERAYEERRRAHEMDIEKLMAAEQHRTALLQSSSWRITAPARWVMKTLRPKD